MHLLAATPGAIGDGQEPVDLGQDPADVVILSAADTELVLLSEARAAMDAAPTLRLGNLMHLSHPLSVDMHLDRCVTKSRLVILRLLGGAGYWRYGFEQFAARLAEAGIPFCALPGDDKPDPELRDLSTVSAEDYDALWAYFVEGGAENAVNLLRYAGAMLEGGPRPEGARPLLRAGVWWPGEGVAGIETARANWPDGAPVVPIVFYRALVQGAGLAPLAQMVKALLRQGLAPLPIFVASLKDPLSRATLETLFEQAPPDVIVNATAFAVGSPHSGDDSPENPLSGPHANGAPVFQVILSGSSQQAWEEGLAGLSARDIAMNVALPEVDGRIITRAISFKGEAFFDEATQCPIATYQAQPDRIGFVAALAANWAALRHRPAQDRRVTLVLANYPNRDGRLANGVGLDTPAATLHVLNLLRAAGYETGPLPADPQALMDRLMSGPTNWLTDRAEREGGEAFPLTEYLRWFGDLPWSAKQALTERWGAAEDDPFVMSAIDGDDPGTAAFKLSIHRFGNVSIGLQPARGYNIDPTETYHSPDLVPPHNYLAFYRWIAANADAVVHMGKHGNLEWLPGKAVALGPGDWPELSLGPMPHIYPFIVNDPGEGTQAKRRAQAVIVDHLTPPLTRAESYGPLRDLEALVDEYYDAAGMDPRRITHLREEILSLSEATGLGRDAGMTGEDRDADLGKLDAFLCDLKEAQIRDGLHVFGQSPEGHLARDLAIALARVPRGDGAGQDASLLRALAVDLGLDFDPLSADLGEPWSGPRPEILGRISTDSWRSTGDTVERLELLSIELVGALRDGGRGDGASRASPPGPASAAVLDHVDRTILPMIARCGPDESRAILKALDGRAIPPGPSGAPTRGRLDTLPTGRNFFSVDSRAVPTPTAWALGWKSANLLIEKHLQTEGDWPRALLVTAWGTANMRTGGDDVAQALALMGVKPRWDAANRRVTGFDIIPETALGRPRVDVTLRISGFFRDAFPSLVALFDSAARAVQALDESDEANPAAARHRAGENGARVYGSKPGAYGAGLQAMIDERLWGSRADLGEAYLAWGSYAYGAGTEGQADRAGFEARLRQVEAIVQNQDNREHDILDSDDYYQFEGGAAAAVSSLQGRDRPIYHNDHSRPERPVIRTLDEEIARVIRSRVVNPKWIDGVKRHGYKGAFEIAATVDYLFAFSATTGAVANHHFDLVEEAFLGDDDTRDFIAEHNAPALADIADRLAEAIERDLWRPRSNSARARIDALRRG
ncbi:cobaltochelatase subunit CobN [Ponticoccus sp. SC2-23]|uniref:cobaltochelatase subunit CobN n=1 Tax=Alexandriicola marinus TaxID=2081710 RepID=UPI000FD945F4|nr:cobaltochelatase subunit CobN [Alexandriicola marinus]MBM1221945.1 cobaltochelatase subunit CobN [Ponticoccus sp. SC6-9]MBM1226296.1 cobaltochelatase subunit CobN [Ponticoccus sp. SC6-15]MBM1230892.1 cobaltochelatase subunit CobN [Ponticoccus sp. SC6-38]MBM1235267.1 cobaltochelatase subunit CobN [Ponticoccus sp. SC6-45]MBM1239914.1 cobaltochelatase subunit CobN [Ponticoccus sp. SC6-49]MBM1244058.1 cobaltochelatase subunit CobN [Ponticoccus sp. SC2-64]MBM1248791.1 cobaltochelatase subunit 